VTKKRHPRPAVKFLEVDAAYVAEGRLRVYLREPPDAVPRGVMLMHNFPPGEVGRPLADGSFRAWLEPTDRKRCVRCRCGWAARSGPHYRARKTTGKSRSALRRDL